MEFGFTLTFVALGFVILLALVGRLIDESADAADTGERAGRDARRQTNRQQQPEPGGAASSWAISGEKER